MEDIYILGAGLAIGLSGLGVGICEGLVAQKAFQVMGKDTQLIPTLLIFTILGIALVESTAIYGLIIAFKIVSLDPGSVVEVSKILGAGFAVGIAGFGVAVGEGQLVSGSLDAIHRNPSIKGKIMTLMILFLALVESAAIYGLVIAIQLLK